MAGTPEKFTLSMTAQQVQEALLSVDSKIDTSALTNTLISAAENSIPTSQAVNNALEIISGDFSSLGLLSTKDQIQLNSDETIGSIPITKGGTGATSKQAAQTALGIVDEDGINELISQALPELEIIDLESDKVENQLQIEHGGTGSTTQAGARSNLGVDSKIETNEKIITNLCKLYGGEFSGYFDLGFVIDEPTNYGVDVGGNIWKYIGSDFPYQVPLRFDPSNDDEFEELRYGPSMVENLNSIKDLETITTPKNGQKVSITGFYPDTVVGGGDFVYQPLRDRDDHNGGTVISPAAVAAWDGTQGDLTTLLDWSGAGTGCWVRINAVYVDVTQFGAIGDYNPDTKIGFDNAYVLNFVFNKFKAVFIPNGNYGISDEVAITNSSGSRKIWTPTSNNAASLWRLPTFNVGDGTKSMLAVRSSHNYIDGLMIVPESGFTGLQRDVNGVSVDNGSVYGAQFERVRVLGGKVMYNITHGLECRLTHCQGSGGETGFINNALDTQWVDLLLQDTSGDGVVLQKGGEGWNLHSIRTAGDGLRIEGGDPVILYGYYMDTVRGYGLNIDGVGGCQINGMYVLKNGEGSEAGETPSSVRLHDCSGTLLSGGKLDVQSKGEHQFSVEFSGDTYCNTFVSLVVPSVSSKVEAQKNFWTGCSGVAAEFNHGATTGNVSIGGGQTQSFSLGVPVREKETSNIGTSPLSIPISIPTRYSTQDSGFLHGAINISNSPSLMAAGVNLVFGPTDRFDINITNISYSNRVVSFDVTNNAGTSNALQIQAGSPIVPQ